MSGKSLKKMVIGIEDNPVNLSPVAHLTINFSDTSLSTTSGLKIKGQNLSMTCLNNDTPLSSYSSNFIDDWSGTPRFNRASQRSVGGKGSLMRRLNSAPATGIAIEGKSQGRNGNKENARMLLLSPLKRGEIPISTSLRSESSFDNHDGSSQDSGFSQEDSEHTFQFAEPNGFPPRKVEPSLHEACDLSPSPDSRTLSASDFPSVNEEKAASSTSVSFSSTDSFDDGFLEMNDLDKSFTNENKTELPAGLDNLLNKPILSLNDTIPLGDGNEAEEEGGEEDVFTIISRRPLRGVNSLSETYYSPATSKVRVRLFRDDVHSPGEASPVDKFAFKRARESEAGTVKRRKYSCQGIGERVGDPFRNPRYTTQRSISDTAAFSLASAMHKPDLIADFSRPYALPVISGRHEDLKSISSETLADLINGNYSNTINSFRIIDCRYPYEYEGGHIKGSINLYTKEQVQQELLGCTNGEITTKSCQADRRNILIFHCEFSLERGPTLYRFLRRCDRNVSSYPSLQYPEVYLLHGGYESFFASHKSLCEPCSYQPMVDPKHENDLKKFRTKSSSWGGDIKRPFDRTGLKRLGLF